MKKNKKLNDPMTILITTIGAGYGSAFFVCENLIATNIHVVAGATSVFAELIDHKNNCVIKKFHVEEVRAFDGKNDLIILKINNKGIPFLLSDDEVQTEESIQVIGYPGKKYKVSNGTVCGFCNRDKWIQMKVETAKGNSGGPVLNSKEQVIGIHARGDDSYGYAVPSNVLKELLLIPDSTEPLEHWNKQEVSRAYVYYLQGEEKRGAGHYERAITCLDKAICLCPSYAIFYHYRGNSRYLLGKSKAKKGNITEAQAHYKDAIEDYTKIIQIEPKSTEGYLNRADIRCLLGKSAVKEKNVVEAQQHY